MKSEQSALSIKEVSLIAKLLEIVYTHETELSKFLKDIDVYSMKLYWYISDNSVYDKIEIFKSYSGLIVFLPISQYSYEQLDRRMLMIFQLMTSFISNVSLMMFKQKHLFRYILSNVNLYDISNDVLCNDKHLMRMEDVFMTLGQLYMAWHQPDLPEQHSFINIDREHYGSYCDIVKRLILDTRD